MSVALSDKIIQEIREGKLKNVYFLCGQEPYFIDKISNFIQENALPEEQKAFNQMVVYAKDFSLENVLIRAEAYPMIGDKNLIIVKEAGEYSRKIEKLKTYFKNIQAQTILVFNYKYKDLPQPKTFEKLLKDIGILFESKKIYENKMPAFIEDIVQKNNYKIQTKAVQMLIESTGTNLNSTQNELQKLFDLLPKNSEITATEIEQYVGINKDFNIFELQKAIGTKNIVKCYQIIQYFSKNAKQNPIQVTISMLYNYFSNVFLYHSLNDKTQGNVAKKLKINPFFVKDYAAAARFYPIKKTTQIIDYLLVADKNSKGMGAPNISDADIQKELLFKILK